MSKLKFWPPKQTTVYTYRTKLLDREGFEERIRRIGLFDAEVHLYKTEDGKQSIRFLSAYS